jgi:hypothetical protein
MAALHEELEQVGSLLALDMVSLSSRFADKALPDLVGMKRLAK